MASSPQPAPARAAATPKVVPDYVAVAQKADQITLSNIEQNPIYQATFSGESSHQARIAKVKDFLIGHLQDEDFDPAESDKRSARLAELIAAIQVMRRQLGAEQVDAITSKEQANFQRILNETTTDVETYQRELAPLCDLGDLFVKFGTDGNIIEKISQAREQKRQREQRLTDWSDEHNSKVLAFRQSVAALEQQIAVEQKRLAEAWIGKAAIQARIVNAQSDLEIRQIELNTAIAETPDVGAPTDDIEQIDERILELQNIGGEKFKTAVVQLRDHTKSTIAKLSTNFDDAIAGLTTARTSFIEMDRQCSDATFALTVLEIAVQQAEEQARTVAQNTMAKEPEGTDAEANLERMERQQRSEQILDYCASLNTFLKDLTHSVTALRKGQNIIKSVLRVNSQALESANSSKISGIANTADAMTTTMLSIIEIVNRAAVRALNDGLSQLQTITEEGRARMAGGELETLEQQNAQLQSFIESVADLKTLTADIATNTVDKLREQYGLIEQMRTEGRALADVTQETERAMFNARAGVNKVESGQPTPTTPSRPFNLRRGNG